MYKHVALLARADGRSHDEFVEYWQANHVHATRDAPGVVKHASVYPVTPAHAEFDALEERYFADLDTLRAGCGDAYWNASDDVDAFLDGDRSTEFAGEVVTQRDDIGGHTDGRYKHAAFLVRKDGMTREAFIEYWQENHTPIARNIEGVVKYDTVLPVDDDAPFDGVAELYFDDIDALHAALGSEGSRDYDPDKGYAKRAREDVDNFLAIDRRPRFIGREAVLTDDH